MQTTLEQSSQITKTEPICVLVLHKYLCSIVCMKTGHSKKKKKPNYPVFTIH